MSRLSIIKLIFVPVFVLLFSLGIFSFKSNAQVVQTLPMLLGTHTDTGRFDPVLLSSNIPSDDFCFSFIWNRTSDGAFYPIIVTSNKVSFTYYYDDIFGQNFSAYITQDDAQSYNFGDSTYFIYLLYTIGQQHNYKYYGVEKNTSVIYTTWYEAFTDWQASQGPDFADFGLFNFRYSTAMPDVQGPLANFILGYNVSWSGTSNNDFPITSVEYKVYGYYDYSHDVSLMDGVLIESGSANTPFTFRETSNVAPLLNEVQKVVLYFIPYSNNTQGNINYIVCDIFDTNITANVFGFDVPTGRLLGFSKKYGDGVINVPYTDVIQINDYYYPIAYVDDVPVTNVIENKSGYINVINDSHSETTYYNTVNYGDNVTNNNQVYNNQVYNYNYGSKNNINDDDYGYINAIVQFLILICTFFVTCWSSFSLALQFLPQWVAPLITTLTTLLGTIVVGLGILKLLKGVL